MVITVMRRVTLVSNVVYDRDSMQMRPQHLYCANEHDILLMRRGNVHSSGIF